MDIVDRLKTFIAQTGLTASQFADAANIPRPTLSQILSGRNKKVSNEVLSKLHAAYPALNMLWLIFGEQSMGMRPNSPTSEPQHGPNLFDQSAQSPINEDNNTPQKQTLNAAPGASEKLPPSLADSPVQNPRMPKFEKSISTPASPENLQIPHPQNHDFAPATNSGPSPSHEGTNSVNTIQADTTQNPALQRQRTITSIIVFYDDNSFEKFKVSKNCPVN